ncbi:MAG: isoprenylcysteine carboxylmethyltransferase family protein [Pseudomonadota bacterium]
MSNDSAPFSDRPNRLPWPPMILVLALFGGYLLQNSYPTGIAFPGNTRLIGGGVIALALLIDVAAMYTLWRGRTTILPNQKSDNLVASGIFRLSRNPIYVANVLLIIGFALRWSNAWLFLLAPLAGLATQELAIKREEKHLEAQFGDEYLSYKSRVRRWL